MKIKCGYCGSFIDDTNEKCPNCGGVNDHLVRSAHGVPKTIEELKQWCLNKNIPLEQARFFIGEDYRGARAFGIYKDENTENFIVYKNKSDGSRAVRYEGKDEAYAVNELYMRLKEEILNQKQHLKQQRPSSSVVGLKTSRRIVIGYWIFIVISFIFTLLLLSGAFDSPNRGYYSYNNSIYYYQPSDGWYQYDSDDWSPASVDRELSNNYENYKTFGSDDADSFYDSGYYYEDSTTYSDYDSDWDSDSSWDSGSDWDSGATDWDSDW
ncbi:MAG TPA: zinc ribbon domain-containing protein [Lachnospiraceae bacterium]|nr:zinc ribbon domain-containing protein [Lachnospiraceae bacterium]